MNKLRLTKLMCILSQFICIGLFAQEKDFVPNFTPPSPTAYELGKYGQIPIGMFTGTPNVNIPLYEYKTKNLSVPISLSYSSNGIKVDQVETNVGLGWSLNAGGVISRIIRGKPDEEDLFFYPGEDLSIQGVHSALALKYFYEASNGDHDTESDLFMFNFQGHSGKFVYDRNKKIVLMPYQDVKVEPFVDSENSGYVITTSDGVKYFFYSVERTTNTMSIEMYHPENRWEETAWYLSKIVHPNGDEIYFTYTYQDYSYNSSISQTLEVVDPGSHECNMIPVAPTIPWPITYTNLTMMHGVALQKISSNNPFDGEVVFTSGEVNQGIAGYSLISNISIRNKDHAEIEKFDFQYLNTSNFRKFLQKVVFKDPSRSYQFEYNDPEGLPERLSFSQDHWGYYNGKPNSRVVPKINDDYSFMFLDGADKEPDGNFSVKGLLERVTYPTKGYTQLNYEPNSYYAYKTIPGVEIGTSLGVSNIENYSYKDTTQIFTSMDVQRVAITVGVSFNEHGVCDPEDIPRATVNLWDDSNNPITLKRVTIGGQEIDITDPSFSSGETCYAYLGVGNYKITVTAYQCTNASATFTYGSTPPETIQENIETGGQRIKRVVAHDPITNKDNITRYYYGTMEHPDRSLADAGSKPYYISDKIVGSICTIPDLYYPNQHYTNYIHSKVLSSSSLTSLFNTGNSNTYYFFVTISHGGDNFENGGEEHEFTVNRDAMGRRIFGENDIKGAPYANFGWDNGLEKKVRIFKKNGSAFKILKETFNHYTTDSRNYSEVNNYSIRKNYETFTIDNPLYQCTFNDILNSKMPTGYTTCNATDPNHKHNYINTGGDHTKCIAPGANNVPTYYYFPCYHHSIGDTVQIPGALSNLDIMEYKNLSYWSYLDSTENKQYDMNGENPITSTTHYYYENPYHIQLTRTETKGSDGKTLTTKTYYPDDNLVNIGFSTEQDQLIKRLGGSENGLHRIAEPVQTEQLDDNQKVLTRRTLYKGWIQNGDTLILPEVIQASTGSNSLESRVRYSQCDKYGNPLEVSKENDVVCAYYWGYHNRNLTIKADNTSYSVLSSSVQASLPAGYSTLDGLLDTVVTKGPTDPSWVLFNKNLRKNAALSKAMVITYSYNPMVGVTSQTDPNGITTYYEYDGFGRLYLVKDYQGNVLKRYDYNYSQP